MSTLTFHVALPFVRDDEGHLCPDQPIECPSPAAAVSRARAQRRTGQARSRSRGLVIRMSANMPTLSSWPGSATCRATWRVFQGSARRPCHLARMRHKPLAARIVSSPPDHPCWDITAGHPSDVGPFPVLTIIFDTPGFSCR